MNNTHRIMPHSAGNRFYNYPNEPLKSVLLTSCAMYAQGWNARATGMAHLHEWHTTENGSATLPHHPYTPTITWIGHATFLISFPHITIITDPVFDDLTFLFRRYIPVGIERENLPHIDAVLISHNHRDHMERSTLVRLAEKYNPVFFVPKGDASWLRSWGIQRVVESMWWDTHTIDPRSVHPADARSAQIMFLPARHWSQRSLFDINRSLWGSWMIKVGEYHCYFAGDTAYGEHFKSIAQEFPLIHTALMPIGPCEPFHWLKTSHINAEQAGTAFLELNAHTFIPMHWGTFGFGVDHPLLPLERMSTWWNETKNIDPQRHQFLPLRIGQIAR